MRLARIKGEGTSFYHCVSRVVEGRFLFRTQSPGSAEAEHFVYLMRRLERACQVQVLTYALLRNFVVPFTRTGGIATGRSLS
jgi:hypothetical protein